MISRGRIYLSHSFTPCPSLSLCPSRSSPSYGFYVIEMATRRLSTRTRFPSRRALESDSGLRIAHLTGPGPTEEPSQGFFPQIDDDAVAFVVLSFLPSATLGGAW